ncbi:MAG: three-Cys-motif partner protein TcmP [bacterium]
MKPKKLPILNADTEIFAWNYEEQTQIKHQVLSEYFKQYAKILGSWRETLYFDCHGGCGVYVKNKELYDGSAILIDKVAQLVFPNCKDKYKVIVCESERDNFLNLNKVLKYSNASDRIYTYNKDFNEVLKERDIINDYMNRATLFFIDPFGYYNVPMATFSKLLKGKGNEILINFMFDFLNRGIGVEHIDEKQLTAFFGGIEWKQAKDLRGNERERFLISLYKHKLKELTGVKYVYAYRICYPNKQQTYYYLVHATNHKKGITLMKSSFAAFNNGHVEYLGKRNGIETFFDLNEYKQADISTLLIRNFKDKVISFDQIWSEIVEDTIYLEKDLRNTLKQMEINGSITVQRISSKTTRGLGGKDKIIFKE